VPRFHRVGDERVQFTTEEESDRDAEEAQDLTDKAARESRKMAIKSSQDKIADKTITFEELRDYITIKEGLS
jgi:hypothetical protein